MPLASRRAFFLSLLGTAAVLVACKSERKTGFDPNDGGTGIFGDPNANVVSDESLNVCATLRDRGLRLPADLFFMVDTSGSMHTQASAGASKWIGARSALENFVSSPDSIGVGVALDYFPHRQSGGAQSCSSSSGCRGESCALKHCKNIASPSPRICDSDGDCGGGEGSCAVLGVCQNDQYMRCGVERVYCTSLGAQFACGAIGQACTNAAGSPLDANGFPLGNCIAATRSVCGDPTTSNDSCVAAEYETPEVAMAVLPGNAAAIKAKLASLFPNGATPTHPALGGALKTAVAYKKKNATHVVAVVFATDGKPEGCDGATPTDIPTISGLAESAFKSSGVQTFVIGVAAPSEKAGLQPMLDAVAQKGGTRAPFMVTAGAATSQDFAKALEAIRSSSFLCNYQLPKPEAGAPDFNKVNVEVEAGNGAKSVHQYVKTADKCNAQTGGWYYDVDPAAAAPTRVSLCDATCGRLKADVKAKVNIVQGCVTRTDPPR